jgi:hypothetical protein
MDFLRSWTDSGPLETAKKVLESALFRSPEPQPVSAWRMLIDPPMPYWVTIFSQACRLISLLILLPIILIGVIDFAGYAVFRTLGKSLSTSMPSSLCHELTFCIPTYGGLD